MHSFDVAEEKPSTNAGNIVESLQETSVREVPFADGGTPHQLLGGGDSKGQTGPSRDTSRKRGINNTHPMVIESPDWLPKGWITEVKRREHGLTAGTRDKYYFDPVSGHRFRSKPEVLRFLDSGQISRTKSNPKSKLLGSAGTGNGEAQLMVPASSLHTPDLKLPVPASSLHTPDLKLPVPASSLHTPDVNLAIEGAIDCVRAEPNYGSNSEYTQNDEDTSTCQQTTKEMSISTTFPLAGAVNQLSEAIQAASPEGVKANKQDELSPQCEKNKLGSHQFKLNACRKHRHPGSVGKAQEQKESCSNCLLVHQNLNEECDLRDPGISLKRQRMARSLNGPTELHMTDSLNENPQDTIHKPSSPFPAASGSQFLGQGHNLGRLGDSVNEHKISDALIGSTGGQDSSSVHIAAVLNQGPEDAIYKPLNAGSLPRRNPATEHCLASTIICNVLAPSAEVTKMEGNLISCGQLPSSGMLSSNALVNPLSCSTSQESSRVTPIPDPCSPCSVLQHSSLQQKPPSKQKPKINKLLKLKPEEVKRQLVSLGRKICKESLDIAHSRTAKFQTMIL